MQMTQSKGGPAGGATRLGKVRTALEPLIRRALHLHWRFSRGLTVGVRAVVLNERGEVFLIEHSYVSGWHLPGGGVEPGETLLEALARELWEEGGIALAETPRLHGVYFNSRVSRRDHVAVYVVRAFRQDRVPQPNHEIVAHGFFHPKNLPAGVTASTRARLAEVLDGVAVSERW